MNDKPFTLRPPRLDDTARLVELIGEWEVARWLSRVPHPYTLSDGGAYLAQAAGTPAPPPERAAVIEIDGCLAGGIGIDHPAIGFNIGYWLGRRYWGQGVMTRAAALMTRDFFANSRETHLMSGYFSGNEASWAIQNRLGFVFVSDGLMLNRAQGKRLPHVVTQLTRQRFEALQQQRPE